MSTIWAALIGGRRRERTGQSLPSQRQAVWAEEDEAIHSVVPEQTWRMKSERWGEKKSQESTLTYTNLREDTSTSNKAKETSLQSRLASSLTRK